ncbi:carbohydrate sulfotransferase 15-like [Lytechinus variegatus]|uniref:carbohydrate sulfotransferase 15-like n=1 Tax=Lytechinus variegatus TaxID=7654 RepID=UPI001BB24399|nr:carbohydrate sulfotransferase 15-like [Lytechinus variegatus]
MFVRRRKRSAARWRTHALTFVSLCSTLFYFGFYNRSVFQDFFARTEVDDYQAVNEIRIRQTLDKASASSWSYDAEKLRDAPENSLKNLAPQLFKALPQPFSPKFRNPCWDVRKKPRQCLPYFYLIGMPKCGTTDLWNKLIRHPYIADTKKEPHWWSRIRMGRGNVNHTRLNSNPISYYSRFAKLLVNYTKVYDRNISKVIAGDGSASTMWDNRLWRQFYPKATHGPAHVNGELIITIQPDARAIAILRNPSDRLYSDYLYFTPASTLTPQHFHERVQTSIEKFHECIKRLDVRTCTYDTSNIKNFVRLEVGLYSVYFRDWLSFFPRKRLKVIRIEEWHQQCAKTLRELYEFLAIEPLRIPALIKICQDDAENTRSPDKLSLGPMLPETQQLLDEFYAPFNRELARMLGDERYLWDNRRPGSSEESVP